MPLRWWLPVLVALAGCGRSTALVPRGAAGARPGCTLSLPRLVDFGQLEPFGSAVRQVTLSDVGDGACFITAPRLESRPGFTLLDTPTQIFLEPGDETTLAVLFEAGPPAQPADRSGTISFGTTDVTNLEASVWLTAQVGLCDLAVSPSPLELGNVMLGASRSGTVQVANVGNGECRVSGLRLEPGSSPLFSLRTQPPAFTLAPGATATVTVSFTGDDGAPPHRRTGTLAFASNAVGGSLSEVPLSAYINPACTEAAQFIYAVDRDRTFSRFDPVALSWHDIGPLRCPTSALPFSLSVDQRGVAWVLFEDGQLFQVDTATAACSATGFVPGQAGFQVFRMGWMFDASTGLDTLYVSGSPRWPATSSTLGVLDLGSLTVRSIGANTLGAPALAGTGDGQLWGFAPDWTSASQQPVLGRVDPRTGAATGGYFVDLAVSSGDFAIAFHRDSFWLFMGADVWQVPRSSLPPVFRDPNPPPQLVLTSPGRDILGAGASTCAPVR